MSKLLRANLERLKKDKAFWLGNLVLVLLCAWICIQQYINKQMSGAEYPFDYFIFGSFSIMGIVFSIVISLFVGTEYADGTIRNKIIAGHKRVHIYLSNFVLCALVAVAGVFLYVIAAILIGVPILGFFQLKLTYLLLLFTDYLLAAAAYASIFQMVSMLCQSKAHAAVLNLLLAFALLFVGIYLYQRLSAPEMMSVAELVTGEIPGAANLAEGNAVTVIWEPNPDYLTGVKREIYQFFMDFLPGGQTMQIAQGDVPHPYRLPFFSVLIIAASNAAGLILFRRKDIK